MTFAINSVKRERRDSCSISLAFMFSPAKPPRKSGHAGEADLPIHAYFPCLLFKCSIFGGDFMSMACKIVYIGVGCSMFTMRVET